MVIPVSVVVLTLNEEKALPACLKSVASFDEVFVLDSGSTDRTTAIAEAMGAVVVQFTWNGRYPKKKQWALQNVPARNAWLLLLDADESVSPQLLAELEEGSWLEAEKVAFDLPLEYKFAGRKLTHGHRVFKRSLLLAERTAFPEVDDLDVGTMWEVEGHYQPVADGPIGRARGELLHDDPDPLFDYFHRHNRYSDWEAHLRLKPSVRQAVAQARTRQGLLFDKLPCKPLMFFTYSYLVRSGWRDGRAGFDYALALAFYYWQINLKVRELRQASTAGAE